MRRVSIIVLALLVLFVLAALSLRSQTVVAWNPDNLYSDIEAGAGQRPWLRK